MKQRKGILAAVFLLAAVSFAGQWIAAEAAETVYASASISQRGPKNQFVQKNGKWYYYDESGRLVKGWYTSKAGNRDYFGKTGAAKAGILTLGGKNTVSMPRAKCRKAGAL